MMNLKADNQKPFVCQYCGHGYSRESTLMKHVCEQKRRHLAMDEKHVVIGFTAFEKFYQLSQNIKGKKTYTEFAKSPFYNAFVKFGSYVNNVKPLYPEQYIDWVIRSGAKLDQWCRDDLYEKYVIELIYTEPVEVGLQRSVLHMQHWADTNNSAWNHYFRYVSVNRAVYDVRDGKISPWLILNSKSGQELLSKMNDEQLAMLSPVLDPAKWVKKFKTQKSDLSLVKDVVREANL